MTIGQRFGVGAPALGRLDRPLVPKRGERALDRAVRDSVVVLEGWRSTAGACRAGSPERNERDTLSMLDVLGQLRRVGALAALGELRSAGCGRSASCAASRTGPCSLGSASCGRPAALAVTCSASCGRVTWSAARRAGKCFHHAALCYHFVTDRPATASNSEIGRGWQLVQTSTPELGDGAESLVSASFGRSSPHMSQVCVSVLDTFVAIASVLSCPRMSRLWRCCPLCFRHAKRPAVSQLGMA